MTRQQSKEFVFEALAKARAKLLAAGCLDLNDFEMTEFHFVHAPLMGSRMQFKPIWSLEECRLLSPEDNRRALELLAHVLSKPV